MKQIYAPAMLAVVLLSAPACSAETPDKAQAPEVKTSADSGSPKFNFSTPTDDSQSANAGSSFNFTPPGSETTPTGGLGAVELPNAGTENLTDFKPTLTIPEEEEG